MFIIIMSKIKWLPTALINVLSYSVQCLDISQLCNQCESKVRLFICFFERTRQLLRVKTSYRKCYVKAELYLKLDDAAFCTR